MYILLRVVKAHPAFEKQILIILELSGGGRAAASLTVFLENTKCEHSQITIINYFSLHPQVVSSRDVCQSNSSLKLIKTILSQISC